MSILRDFERSLGGDPEPVLRRLVRAGLRPVELAEALQEYLREQQAVTDDSRTGSRADRRAEWPR